MEYHGLKPLYKQYACDAVLTNVKKLSQSSFYKIWMQVMSKGVVDPDTGERHLTYVRKNSAMGFSKCDDCTTFEANIAAAKTRQARECAVRVLRAHQEDMSNDRIELARIVRKCKTDKRHVGWIIDAVDRQKFGIVTSERESKSMSKLGKIIQKITGAQSFKDDTVKLFSTLPDVPTGGNLTLSIICELLKTEEAQQATDLYFNVDGASDNICYHVVYGLAWLLHCAKKSGWPLQRIHLLRFQVIMNKSFRFRMSASQRLNRSSHA